MTVSILDLENKLKARRKSLPDYHSHLLKYNTLDKVLIINHATMPKVGAMQYCTIEQFVMTQWQQSDVKGNNPAPMHALMLK